MFFFLASLAPPKHTRLLELVPRLHLYWGQKQKWAQTVSRPLSKEKSDREPIRAVPGMCQIAEALGWGYLKAELRGSSQYPHLLFPAALPQSSPEGLCTQY